MLKWDLDGLFKQCSHPTNSQNFQISHGNTDWIKDGCIERGGRCKEVAKVEYWTHALAQLCDTYAVEYTMLISEE